VEYQDFAINLAKQAGEIIRTNFVLGMQKEIKSDNSPVTKTDLAINKLVIEEVKKHFPDYGVLGEEESNIIQGAEFNWVCDPVDGTIPFSHGMPTCAFSLALVQNGVPILGVAYDPFMDRMLVAEKCQGAFLNGERVNVSKHPTLKKAYISHCNWHAMEFPMPSIVDDLVFNFHAHSFGVGSVVYNAMLLAFGEIDGMTFGHTTAHDVAAIKVFVEEAGGKVTDINGNEQRYDKSINGCLISNGLIHNELVQIVQKHLKKI
jgi:fructose-1,6-bisphosphatase/inositol monophosphatase family enzyme